MAEDMTIKYNGYGRWWGEQYYLESRRIRWKRLKDWTSMF